MRYARNSSSFKSFSDTREKFWKRLRVRGYPFSFLLSLFREIRYSDRRRWLAPKSKHGIGGNKTILSSKPPLTAVTHVSRMLLAKYYQIWTALSVTNLL